MIRLRALFAAALAVGFLGAFPVRAEDSDGLPQLNTALFPEQLFWLAVTFALLYLLMAFVGLPAVQRTQDKRAEKIAADLAAAQAANEAAKNMMAQYEKALAEARTQAQTTIGAMAAEAAQESAAKQTAQRLQLAKRLQEAEAKIAAARDAAIKDIKGTASGLADAIVEKMTGAKAHAAQGGKR